MRKAVRGSRPVLVALVAALAAGCSGGSSSGGVAASSPPTSPTPIATPTDPAHLTVRPVQPTSAAALARAASVLHTRLGDDAMPNTVTVDGKTLDVTVNQSDAAKAPLLITQVGRMSFHQVLEAVNKPAQSCRNGDVKAFPKGSVTSDDSVLCDPADGLLLLLGRSYLDNSDFTRITTEKVTGSQTWSVEIHLSSVGAAALAFITEKAYVAIGSATPGFAFCKPPHGCNALAVVIDGGVIEVPTSPSGGVQSGILEVSGYTHEIADRLAAILESGPLPVALTVKS